MEIKIFGKKVFEFAKSKSEALIYTSTESLKRSEFLPDFYTFRANSNDFAQFVSIAEVQNEVVPSKLKPVKPKEKSKIFLTPKGVYELKMLNDKSFVLNTNTEYVDEQIRQFKDKLSLISSANYDMSYGTNEIASILVRLISRKKYKDGKVFFENFAYTTTSKIDDVVKVHSHLQLGQVEQFLADMPKEAVDVMKEYTANTEKLCGKKPIFYIIANKEDFKKSEKRRDPILLAQSPFAHVWQILGAWDKEMLLLENL